MGKIDVDRGVSIRQIVKFHNKDNPASYIPDPAYGGAVVYMYKDDPGVYYDVHGNKLPEALAERAGFPVKKLAKQRAMKDAEARFRDEMAKQLALDEGEEVVLAEAGDWQVVGLPMNRAKIVDKETGQAVNSVPMTVEDAKAFLGQLTEVKAGVTKEVAKAKANPRQEK